MNVIPKTAEQVAEKAGKKVVSVTKHAISTTLDTATHPTAAIKRVQHTNNSSEGSSNSTKKIMGTQDVHKHQETKHTATTTMPLPPTRNKLNVDRTTNNIATHTQRRTPQPSSSDTLFSISNQSTTFLITIYTALLSIYHAYSHKSDILQNAFPFSVVIPLVVVAFLMGYMLDKFLILFSSNEQEIERRERESSGRRTVRRANGKRRFSNLSIQARRGGMIHGGNGTEGGVYQPTVSDMTPENNIDESTQTDTDTDEEGEEEESSVYFSRTREFFKPGWKRKKIKKKYEKYVKEFNHYGGNSERSERSSGSKREMTAQFFTNLNPMKRGDVKEWEVKLKAPFRESPLMGELPCFC